MKNLAYYMVVNKKYYSFISHLGQDYDIEEFMDLNNLKAYHIFVDEIYIKALSNKHLPNQGWKIHISVTQNNATDILKITINYLSLKKISFKIIKNLDIYLATSGKAFSREQFGKFITIYPENSTAFEQIIEDLYNLLSEFDGPEILTDKRYKDSKVVYYRYGGFTALVKYDSWGMPTYYIYDGNGNLVEDQRKPYYTIPDGIKDYNFQNPNKKDSKLFFSYKIIKALHFSNTGGTYFGIQKSTSNRVIIKEARPYTQIDEFGRDAISFRRKEQQVLKMLYGDELIPKYIEDLYDQDHYFLIEEYVEGITLYDFIAKNNPFLRLEDEYKVRNYLKKVVIWSLELYRFLLHLRKCGFIMHDLCTDNIMISTSDKLKVIDLEGVEKDASSTNFLAKNDVTRNKTCVYPDMCELGLILYSSLFLKDSILQLDIKSIGYFFKYLETIYAIPHSFRKLINQLLFAKNNSCLNLESLFNDVLLDLESKNLMVEKYTEKRFNYPCDLYPKFIVGVLNTYNSISDSVFPLTPIYSNDMNMATGIFGIIYGLHFLGCTEIVEKLINSFRKQVEEVDGVPSGLLSGWGGVIYVMLKIGKNAAAEHIFTRHIRKKFNSSDFTLATGVAGDIIVLLELNRHTHKTEYLHLAVEYGNNILHRYNYVDNEKIGFAEGNAGIALALYYLYSTTKNINFIEFGKKLLDEEMKYAFNEENYVTFCAEKNSNIRYPYFMRGTAGILAVILRYGNVDSRFNKYAIQLADGLHYGFTISADLFEGMAGIGNVLLDCYFMLKNKKYLDWAYDAANFCCAHRILDEHGNYVFVDHFLQRVAVDYGYGSIGIMLFLQRINKKTTNFALFDDLLEVKVI